MNIIDDETGDKFFLKYVDLNITMCRLCKAHDIRENYITLKAARKRT